MSLAIQYSSTKGQDSPEGRPSYSREAFRHRFQPSSLDWDKPVAISAGQLTCDRLLLARQVYAGGTPDARYTNGESILLFEEEKRYLLVPSDFFTRLIFTEPALMKHPITVGTSPPTTMEAALRSRRSPSDPFWSSAGLPGIPLAIGVHASLRSSDSNIELLAHKDARAQGGMANTVGPPVSAGLLAMLETLEPAGLTLGKLVDGCMRAAAERELSGLPLPTFSRQATWLDQERGFKPEVTYRAAFPVELAGDYRMAVCHTHAGCLTIQGHLDSNGQLTDTARQRLSHCGLNFQAWGLWPNVGIAHPQDGS